MSMRLGAVLLMLTMGCATPVTVVPPPSKVLQKASEPKPWSLRPLNAEDCTASGVSVPPIVEAKLECEDGRCSRGDFELVLRNCLPEAVRVEDIQMDLSDCSPESVHVDDLRIVLEGRGLGWELTETDIPPRTELRHLVPLPLRRTGAFTLYVLLSEEARSDSHLLSTLLHVTRPDRAEAMAACRACDGEWGVWGLSAFEGCNCKANDAGKTCVDSDQCEGLCLHQKMVPLTPATICDERYCSVRRKQGVRLGVCSEYRMNFGCNRVILHGDSQDPLVPLGFPVSRMCCD